MREAENPKSKVEKRKKSQWRRGHAPENFVFFAI
jgi:hypothetical protein